MAGNGLLLFRIFAGPKVKNPLASFTCIGFIDLLTLVSSYQVTVKRDSTDKGSIPERERGIGSPGQMHVVGYCSVVLDDTGMPVKMALPGEGCG